MEDEKREVGTYKSCYAIEKERRGGRREKRREGGRKEERCNEARHPVIQRGEFSFPYKRIEEGARNGME